MHRPSQTGLNRELPGKESTMFQDQKRTVETCAWCAQEHPTDYLCDHARTVLELARRHAEDHSYTGVERRLAERRMT